MYVVRPLVVVLTFLFLRITPKFVRQLPVSERFRSDLRMAVLFVSILALAVVTPIPDTNKMPPFAMTLVMAELLGLMFWEESIVRRPRRRHGPYETAIFALIVVLMFLTLYSGNIFRFPSIHRTKGLALLELFIGLFLFVLFLVFSRRLFPTGSWAADPFKLLAGVAAVVILIVVSAFVTWRYRIPVHTYRYVLQIGGVALIFLGARFAQFLSTRSRSKLKSDGPPVCPL